MRKESTFMRLFTLFYYSVGAIITFTILIMSLSGCSEDGDFFDHVDAGGSLECCACACNHGRAVTVTGLAVENCDDTCESACAELGFGLERAYPCTDCCECTCYRDVTCDPPQGHTFYGEAMNCHEECRDLCEKASCDVELVNLCE